MYHLDKQADINHLNNRIIPSTSQLIFVLVSSYFVPLFLPLLYKKTNSTRKRHLNMYVIWETIVTWALTYYECFRPSICNNGFSTYLHERSCLHWTMNWVGVDYLSNNMQNNCEKKKNWPSFEISIFITIFYGNISSYRAQKIDQSL